MKDMFESSEAFTAYATIDAANYMLNELSRKRRKMAKRAGIVAEIDRVTGYGDAMLLEDAVSLRVILEDKAKAMEFIGIDNTMELATIAELDKILPVKP